ncbi:MAG: aminotransferase class V-fold PLP-dependent enzyme [Chloroflexi bacterium]|nr:aminotransferase class V-fold PLP-dependent enzyme [Chloroflexota bacterium]
MPYYSSVHRGTGFKSRLSTAAYDRAHQIIGEFVGANLESNTVIFGKNSTEALNKLAFRFPFQADDIVITTQMEHHSNDLPWRKHAQVVHVHAKANGRFDEDHFDHLLAKYAGRVALVAVTGASNVSGYLQPISRLARKAHAAGALILVDTAQMAPIAAWICAPTTIQNISISSFYPHIKCMLPLALARWLAPKRSSCKTRLITWAAAP